jgi:hypothetical protein
MGAIVTELLTIHDGNYVVRALVQLGGLTLMSGMAAASTIESAEDQAKIRALQAFGMAASPALASPQLPYLSQNLLAAGYRPPEDYRTSDDQASEAADLPHSNASALEIAPLPDAPIQSAIAPALDSSPVTQPLPSPDLSLHHYSSNLQDLSESELPLLQQPIAPPDLPETAPEAPELTAEEITQNHALDWLNDSNPTESLLPVEMPAKSDKSEKSRRKTESATKTAPVPTSTVPTPTVAPLPQESIGQAGDRSNEIAKIGVEMKRLGWTTEQGRSYLKRTYGKRSRQELNDDELIDFLRYLEAQPSPSTSPF